MADLAIVFHWTPTDCADFSLRELMEWRERARQRSMNEAPHGAQPPPPGAAHQRR
ncbi:GpE family phage tail protein [Salinicola endophyticus]|uniref:GpE family phage tail protein n=1 Tax=Salinicola endophyticus TaxID=1949083 RepID=A0ABY8FDY7_9GAMM|nr:MULTISPECIES: GpE family phage tail protein [Salinicola]WFF40767.1 GpE family phage tail protein [Salinicola endophyticus]